MKPKRSILQIAGPLLLPSAWLLGVDGLPVKHQVKVNPFPFVSVQTGVSPPLREMNLPRPKAAVAAERQTIEATHRGTPTTPAPRIDDPRVQRRSGAGMPEPIQSFEGTGDVNIHPGADANVAVGPNEVAQYLRFSLQIWDKSGNSLTGGPVAGDVFWQDFAGGNCSTTQLPGEPIVIYDQLADRWVWSAWSLTGAHHQCFAVSITGDPLGGYYLYDFLYPFSAGGGLPRISMWPDAYFMTARDQGDPPSPTALAFDRNAMLAGLPASGIGVSLEDPNLFGLLPTNLDSVRPPTATDGGTVPPNILMAIGHPDRDGSPTPRIHIYYFHPDFSSPDRSTFTGPFDLEVDPFVPVVLQADFTDGAPVVPQPPPGLLLTAFGGPEFRLSFRNFGDHESIVLEHSVLTDGVHVGPRWYEIRDPLGSPFVYQQGTFGPDDGVWRWLASAAMDQNNDIAIGYSVSNDTNVFPGIRYAGRLASDPPGELSQGEKELIAGDNPYLGDTTFGASGLWGYYSSLVVDPDGCTFWYTNMYTPASAGGDWSTRIGSFRFPSCTPGPSGTLEGTVTDGRNPLAGVRVTAGASSRITDASGHYSFTLAAGAYGMTASKYGLLPGAVSGVAVSDGGDTVQNFALSPARTSLVTGVVRDGSGGTWPLYARIEVSASGAPTITTFTDPVSGSYRVRLVSGMSYIFTVTAVTPGYEPGGGVVTIGTTTAAGGMVVKWTLSADQLACTAVGYRLSQSGFFEDFNLGALPPGWSVANDNPDGAPWQVFDGPACGFTGAFTGNQTGGSGPFAAQAVCDGGVSDTSLFAPSVDLSGLSNAFLRFNSDFACCYDNETADVDISTNDGATWSNVLHRSSNARGPRVEQIDITGLAAGQPNVRARFHFTSLFSAFWQVDNVLIGQASCSRGEGGLVVGNVRDANTRLALNGATVTNSGGLSATTLATPDDPNQDDGLYILFAPTGRQRLTASLLRYGSDSENVTVVANSAIRHDFKLTSGFLAANPSALTMKLDRGKSGDLMLTLTNKGRIDAHFQIHAGVPGTILKTYPLHFAFPAGILFNTRANDFWVSNPGPPPDDFPGDNLDHRFLTDGTDTGDTIDVSSVGLAPMDGAYNPKTGMLWQIFGLSGIGCIYELDPVHEVMTGNKICPAFSSQQVALAYDPITDTYYSGSNDDSILNHFDSSGTILESVEVVPHITGLAVNPVTGHLFVLHQVIEPTGPDVYVVDPASDYALIGAFYVGEPGTWGPGARCMDIDCEGHLWLQSNTGPDFELGFALEVDSGEASTCDSREIPWLSVKPVAGRVKAGSSVQVHVGFDARKLTPGVYRTQLDITTDTPYQLPAIPVKLKVLKAQ